MEWQRYIYPIPAILIGLTVHEYSHARMALALGDTTARDQGRITFNPLRHIDILGLIFLLVAGFGWAKPVQFSPDRLRRPRRDKALIALAGPLSNFVLGVIFALLARLCIYAASLMGADVPRFIDVFISVVHLLLYGATINFGLFIFNLIPLPPLDGSHIAFSGLNLRSETEKKIIKLGAPLLFIILIIESRTSLDILPIGRLSLFLVSVFCRV
ncbi:MAG: site-2 protease family protein [Spirochaetaceae bacterium]|jgi:Zn-dependent protease|nr:site-2 protease family protein [Spirochaetaceae bacterium]